MLDAVAVKRAHFGSFEFHPIHLDNVQCTGSEENITQCSYVTSTAINCDHSEDAGVICGSKYICYIVLIISFFFHICTCTLIMPISMCFRLLCNGVINFVFSPLVQLLALKAVFV